VLFGGVKYLFAILVYTNECFDGSIIVEVVKGSADEIQIVFAFDL
jgi:hypothetical protein